MKPESPYSEIVTLLEKWEQFKTANPGGDYQAFGRWLQQTDSEPNPHSAFIASVTREMMPNKNTAEINHKAIAGNIISRLTQFTRQYTKVPFQKIGLGSMEEFRILALIHRLKGPNKSVISRELLLEFSTINDILRRLEEKGWIRQVRDEKDKRSRKISLTESGEKFIYVVYGTLMKIQPSLLGDLTAEEQQQLLSLLTRLDQFHTNYIHHHYNK